MASFGVNERFINNAINEGLRLKNRDLAEIRPVKISLGPALGTSLVEMGNTKVLATVSAEIIRPSSSNSEGYLTIKTEFSPMAFPSTDGDKRSETEVSLSRMLEKMMRKSRAVDTEGLCIIAGEKVWAIHVDVRVLDHDGNVLDCACQATISSLLHFQRPDVTVQGREVTIHTSAEKALISLAIHHIPISITFALFDNGDRHIIDPCLEEELASTGQLTFVVNSHREICAMLNTGSVALDSEKILLCSLIAGSKAKEITEMIRNSIELSRT